jgi:hypothetical protein
VWLIVDARMYIKKAPSRTRWEPAQGAAAKGEEGLSRQFETSPGRRNDYGDPSEVAANSNANGPGDTVIFYLSVLWSSGFHR